MADTSSSQKLKPVLSSIDDALRAISTAQAEFRRANPLAIHVPAYQAWTKMLQQLTEHKSALTRTQV